MTQHRGTTKGPQLRCELLSNLYLCIGWHSREKQIVAASLVVNCFQICIFVSDDTANIVILIIVKSCELLSNLYLCIGWHSSCFELSPALMVVNCFQICIFVSDDTAASLARLTALSLWIAFKFVSLYRMTQRSPHQEQALRSCELLSNLYLCIGWHSCSDMSELTQPVVNCFQICIFVSDDTAALSTDGLVQQLWIAFKFVSLYRMTQQIIKKIMAKNVVNCFQICIFVSDDTA